MLTEDQYNNQLSTLLKFLTNTHSIQSIQQSTLLTSLKQIIKGTSKLRSPTTNSHITHFMIRYSESYSSPVLYFQLYEPYTKYENDIEIESTRPCYRIDQVIELTQIKNFSISMIQCEGQNWWFLHPCNTDEVLQNTDRSHYLINWFSVYGGALFDIRVG